MRVEGWRLDAACRHEHVGGFFDYERHTRGTPPAQLLETCRRCPVANPCLMRALDYEEYGLWAGTTAKDRVFIRKALNIRLKRPYEK